MGLLDLFAGKTPEDRQRAAASARRQAEILATIRGGGVPAGTRARLEGAAQGRLPWIATLTPAELSIARSHGFRPIASVSATCWMHYGWSWTLGHSQGWQAALARLKDEARAAGANAVLDVKMRTVALHVEDSMDFTLVGTAVRVDGLPPGTDPIVATVPALEFIKLLEGDVVPTGIAVGAHYEWMTDWRYRTLVMGNRELPSLTGLWERVRREAHADLQRNARPQGNGVLAHVNFSQMLEREGDDRQPRQYLARHIVVATTLDAARVRGPRDMPLSPRPARVTLSRDVGIAVDLCSGPTPLAGTSRHHQSYASNEHDGAL